MVLAIDVYITLNTFLLTSIFLKVINLGAQHEFSDVLIYQLPQVFIFSLLAFLITSSYKGIVRHTGLMDVINVLKANFLFALFIGLFFIYSIKAPLDYPYKIGKAVIILHFLINTLALIFLRILYKNLYQIFVFGFAAKRKVLIYGAGDAGLITYDSLIRDEKGKTAVFGFLDDSKSKIGKTINGVKVYDPASITEELIQTNKIEEIIVTIQKISPSRLNEIVDMFSHMPVQIKIVPPPSLWLNGNLTTKQIKNIRIEDLLGRPPIQLEKDDIKKEIDGKVVLITGAAGSIGEEISRQLMNYPYKELIMLDQAETAMFNLRETTKKLLSDRCKFVIGDIRNQHKIEAVIKETRPDIVFHAAAYKHVPLMEENPYEAVLTNVKGTKNIADLAVKYGVEKFVMISTDKAVNPTNVMGATKRIAELYVTRLNEKKLTQFIVTRFGNVLGSNGSVIPTFKRQIEQGGPLTVTDVDVTRYFMTIPEACQLVLEAGAMGKGGEIFVFDMGDSVKIMDLAKRIIRLSGYRYPEDIDIEIIGLRPGEKKFEELLTKDEICEKTFHPKIMIAKVSQGDEAFEKNFEGLISDSFLNKTAKNEFDIVSKIKDLVPEFISENSKFSKIDISDK